MTYSPSSRIRGFGSTSIPATGLNPSSITQPDVRLIPRVRRPRSFTRTEEDDADSESIENNTTIIVDFEESGDTLTLRRWVDNTGNYSTVGRLTAVYGEQVRVLKENGRTTTFPIRRLSETDVLYIRQQITNWQAGAS